MSGASDPRTDAVLAKVDGDVQAIISSPEIARSYVIDKIRRERENAALTAEVSRLTENQRLQDSATAAVMERAEKSEARVAELERDVGRLDSADKNLPSGVRRQDVCMWNEDSEGAWDTSCGRSWQFTEDGPAENQAHFCHHCGGVLLATKYSDEIEDDDDAIDAARGTE